jgi:hypothetical protein
MTTMLPELRKSAQVLVMIVLISLVSVSADRISKVFPYTRMYREVLDVYIHKITEIMRAR